MEKKLLSILFPVFLFFLSPWSGFGQCPTSVSISADPGTTICAGTAVTFKANASGGSSYTYEWYLNDQVQSGQTGQSFQLNSVNNSDKIKVIASSSEGESCTPRESTVTITVNATATVSFNINANKTSICPGESVTYSTGPITNGGSSPTYQWRKNGNPISGATSSTFTTSEINSTDEITLAVTSSAQCATPVPAISNNEISIPVNPLPTLTTNNGSVCASGQTNIDLNTLATTNGTKSFYTSEANAINKTSAINATVSPTLQTTYYVRSELSTGCFVTDSIVISINDLPVVDAGSDQAICPGASFDLLTIGSGTNRTFYTSQANADSATNEIDPVATPTSETIYFVRSQNAEGCYNTDSVIIKINPLPSLSISNAAVCAEGQSSIDLNSLVTTNGTATFYKSQADADNKTSPIDATVNPTSQTTYYVRSELSTGCYATDTIVISIDVLPTLSVTNGSVCESNQTNINLETLVTTNGTTISFHSSQVNADSNSSPIDAVVSPSTTTNYFVRSANSQGCYNTAAIEISIDALPTVDAGSDTEICVGDSFDLSTIATGSSTLSYYTSQENAENGSNALSSSTVSPTSTTTYYVRSQASTGCYSTDSVIITVNPDATLTLTSSNNNQTICTNNAITAITYSIGGGGTGANVSGLPSNLTSSYNSDTKAFTISGEPTVAGTYNYEITTTGCGSASATGTLIVDAPITSATPEFDTNPDHNPTAICPVVSGLIYSVIPIEGATSYLWTLPAGWSATTGTTNNGVVTTATNSVTVNVTSSAVTGSKTITVRGDNACGNSNPTSLTVTVNTFTFADAGPDQTVCKGTTTIQLTGEVGGAIGNHKDYDWSDNGAGGSFNIQGNNKLSATYTIPTTRRDNGGTVTINLTTIKPQNSSCQAATDQMIITVLEDATLILTSSNNSQTLCINNAIEEITYTIGEAGTGATATGLPNGITGDFNDGIFTLTGTTIESGTFNYTINTTGSCTNQTSTTGTITVNAITTAEAGDEIIMCQSSNPAAVALAGASIGGGATTGAWSITNGGGSLSSEIQTASPETVTYTPAVDFNGTVTLTLTSNAPGECPEVTDTRTIIVDPAPTVEAGETLTICQSSSPSAIPLTGAAIGGGATTAAWSITTGEGSLSSTTQTSSPQSVTFTPAADFFGEVVLTLTTNAPGTCDEVLDTITITIDPVPIVDAGSDDTVCQSENPESITLSGASVGGGGSTAAWSITSGGGTLSNINQTANPETITYTPATGFTGTVVLTLTTNTPDICTAVIDTREIIIEEAPTVDAGENIVICQSSSPEAIALSGATIGGGSTTGTWTITSGEGTLSSTSPTATPQNITFTPIMDFEGEIILTLTTDAPGTCQAVSETRTITINQVATIDAGQDITVCSNETVTLAGAFGGGASSATWTTSGSGSFSNNNPDAVYTPSTADINNGGITLTYTTNDPDGPCEAMSDSMVLIIKEEIQITTQPQNVGVCVTNSATLSVVAYGDDLSYQWYKGTAPGTAIQGATSATLEFNQATLNDDGTYYVIVGDGTICEAVTSNEVTLNVNEDITIQTQPVSQVVCIGSDVTFSIAATGAIDTYQWRKNNVNIAGANSDTFTIQNAQLSDTDTYDVLISGTGGTCDDAFSAPFTLDVKDIPTVDAGDDFEICSSASSFNLATHPEVLDASSTFATSFNWTTNGGGIISNSTSLTDATYAPVAGDLGDIIVFTLTGILEVDGVQICADAVDTKEISIIPQPELTAFSYTATSTDTATEFCQTDNGTKGPTTAGNNLENGAGVFTVNDSKLVVDSNSGEFTPKGTDPGVYVITYTFNVTSTSGVCAEVSKDFTVTIGANPIATFTYDSGVYCRDTGDTEFNTAPVISFDEEDHENADIFSADNSDLDLNTETGAIDLSNSKAGTYTITRIVDYTGTSEDGCEAVPAEFTITINDRPIPDFTYSATEYCSDDDNPVAQQGADAVLGVFSEKDGKTGLKFGNAEIGEISLATSEPGTYIIVNTVNVDEDGCDPVTDEFTITITKLPNPIFNYTKTDYCITDLNASVDEGYEAGGTFSSETLGSALNANTGVISWELTSTSLIGSHTIKYTIAAAGGCEEMSHSETINIDPIPEGGVLLFTGTGRIFIICEGDSNYAVPLVLSESDGNIVAWKYRTISSSWSTIMVDGQNFTGTTLSTELFNNMNISETTVFRVEVGGGGCSPNDFSETAILSVIPAGIMEPTPVGVDPTVICIGEEVTLTSTTEFLNGPEIAEGGMFGNSSITNHGWRITDENGNVNYTFNSSANNTNPDKWLRQNPRNYGTADITSPYTVRDKYWSSDGQPGFAIVAGDNPSTLETPIFNIDGFDQAILTFDQAYNLTPGASIKVEISTDGGNTYLEEALYERTGPLSSGNFGDFSAGNSTTRPNNKIIIDLGNYMFQGNLRIRFKFEGTRVGDVWATDNIDIPDGPRGAILEWRDYSDLVNFPNGELIGTSEIEKWTPKHIGLNTFEVQTRLQYDSNGSTCQEATFQENVEVFVYDSYTSVPDSNVGTCADNSVELTVEVKGGLQDLIDSYPTADGFTGKWVITASPETYIYNDAHFSGGITNSTAVFTPNVFGTYTLKWVLELEDGKVSECENDIQEITFTIYDQYASSATASTEACGISSITLEGTMVGSINGAITEYPTPDGTYGEWQVIEPEGYTYDETQFSSTNSEIPAINDPSAIFTPNLVGNYTLRWAIINENNTDCEHTVTDVNITVYDLYTSTAEAVPDTCETNSFNLVASVSGALQGDNISYPTPDGTSGTWEVIVSPEGYTLAEEHFAGGITDPTAVFTPVVLGEYTLQWTLINEDLAAKCIIPATVPFKLFDTYTLTAEAEAGSCGDYSIQLTGTTTGIWQDPIIYPTQDGYIGQWRAVGAGTFSNPDPDDTSEAVNNPNAIFTADALGNYTFIWELVPDPGYEGEFIENTSCPATPAEISVEIKECIALDFDGVNDYVDLGENYTASYSLEAWFMPEQPGGSIISGPGYNITTPTGATIGKWTHVAVSNSNLYLDGVLQTGVSVPGNGGAKTLIGARWTEEGATDFFNGWIEEVRIWNGTISEENIRFTMNQRLKPTGNIGIEVDMDHPDSPDYANLAGYYQLLAILPGGFTPDLANNREDGKLMNMETLQENTAPLPYYTGNDGSWDTPATWARPDVWKIPNTGSIDWNIVRTSHNITSGGRDITVLGLISEENKLNIEGDNPTSPTAPGTGNYLRITHYFRLDGKVDLNGESQLLQDMGSIVDPASTGSMERDQQGTASSYNYNYWSSPLSPGTGNADYTIAAVLKDGTNPAAPVELDFGISHAHADAAYNGRKKISNYWINKFRGNANIYSEWERIGSSGSLNVGEGYTMKGTSGQAAIKDPQNYVFIGKPNNGDISLEIGTNQNYLLGNPYASAISVEEFILDNLEDVTGGRNENNIFNGTMYFWEHFAGKTHILKEYIGGYAARNLSGGVPAISNDERVNANDDEGNKIPGLYIPVAQGFFINTTIDSEISGSVSVSGGMVQFKNSQRAFVPDIDRDEGDAVFLRPGVHSKQTAKSDTREKIRLTFKSPLGFNRQILVGSDPNTTAGFDLGYDALLNEDNVEDMYWVQENNWLVIQGVPHFEKNQVLPLGVKLKNEGELTIKIEKLENFPEDKQVYLHDKKNDSIHDLRSSAYKASAEGGYHNDRFEIVFFKELATDPIVDVPGGDKPGGGEIPEDITNLTIRYSHTRQEVQILNPDQVPLSNMYIFDLNGNQLINHRNISHEKDVRIPVRNYSSGVYIVKLYSEGIVMSKKIIINN